MANMSGIAVFAGAMAVIALVSVLLFVLRAERIRKSGMTKKDVPMMISLLVALVSLFTFSISLAKIADSSIAMTVSGGLIGLLGLAMIYEIYLLLAHPRRRPNHWKSMWMSFTLASISLIIVGILAYALYGSPNFPAMAIIGLGLLSACYSFFSWLNTRESRRRDIAD